MIVRTARPLIEQALVEQHYPEGRIIATVRVRRDPRTGEISFTPSAMRTFDHLRSLMMQVTPRSTPGHFHALRDALGLSQQEFAAKLKVSSQTVSRWERGESSPSKQALAALRRIQNNVKKKGIAVSARQDRS